MTNQDQDTSRFVRRENRHGIVTLTLDRPGSRNALSMGMMAALQAELDAIAVDPTARVAIIAGAGPAFCAGHDLRELRATPTRTAYETVFATCARLMTSLTRLPKPVIARVHGMASAAGCQLVATCDLAVAGEAARFATPGVDIGLFCSTPMVALTRGVSRKAAMEMLLTGEPISAETAERIGLINRAVPDAELDEAVHDLARRIAAKSALTVGIGKTAFYQQADLDVGKAYAAMSEVMTRNMLIRDAAEGIDAFLQKRQPVWTET